MLSIKELEAFLERAVLISLYSVLSGTSASGDQKSAVSCPDVEVGRCLLSKNVCLFMVFSTVTLLKVKKSRGQNCQPICAAFRRLENYSNTLFVGSVHFLE